MESKTIIWRLFYMEEIHRLEIVQRKRGTVTGILDVFAFD